MVETAAVDFASGDKVQFMRMTYRGSSISLSTRYGKVSEVRGDNVHVKLRNGRSEWVHKTDLRLQKEKSPVHDVFQAFVAGTKEASEKEASHEQAK